jgi:diguanylate cyclase (GGDEF)-like protein
MAARYGGDEFVVVLPNCEAVQAEFVAERIIDNFNHANFRYQGIEIELSASMGIASCPQHGATIDSVIHSADKAMYASKRQGPNLITQYHNL